MGCVHVFPYMFCVCECACIGKVTLNEATIPYGISQVEVDTHNKLGYSMMTVSSFEMTWALDYLSLSIMQ